VPDATSGYAGSSLNRCLWGALLGVRRLRDRLGLEHPALDEWEDHLWAWSSFELRGEFNSWYHQRPVLSDLDMGQRPVPAELAGEAERAGLAVTDLNELVWSTSAILHGNVLGPIDFAWVLENLGRVEAVLSRNGVALPQAASLPPSMAREQTGWGEPLSPSELADIRDLRFGDR